MEIKVEKGDNNTYTAIVSLKPEETTKYLDDALKHEAENLDIEGFRKGKAPMNVVKEKVDKSALRGHALNHIFSEAYSKLIKENKLKPIINPRFNIKNFDDDNNLEFEIIIVEKPEIKLGDYKAELKKKYKAKKEDIGKESKEDEKTSSKDDDNDASDDKSQKEEKSNDEALDSELTNQEIIDVLLTTSKIEVAEVIVNEEVERMVSSLIDQTAKMGITIEQYLESTKKTIDEIREDYKISSTNNIKGDFIVTEIANIEEITVEDSEIEQTINNIPDESSREALSNPEQKMYIKAVLTKTKTLDFLREQSKV